MNQEEIVSVVESLIFVSEKPVSAAKIAEVMGAGVTPAHVEEAVRALMDDYRGRGIQVAQVAGGYQFRTKAEYAEYVARFVEGGRPSRMSRATVETLAVVAYKQPITRMEIEALRGVEVSGILKGLLERGFIRVVGKKETPGRPFLYGTTKAFLSLFSLKDLGELPDIASWRELNRA